MFFFFQIKNKPFVDPSKANGIVDKLKAKVKKSDKNAQEVSEMGTGILRFVYVLFQDNLDENIAQIEEIGTQIIVLLSGIGFNSSKEMGTVYNIFGYIIAILVAMVFVHFIRVVYKEIKSSFSRTVMPNTSNYP